MGTNQPQNLTKKIVMKRFLIMLVCTIIFVLVIVYLQYGRIPSTILIGFAIVVLMMIISVIAGFKHRNSTATFKSKVWYFLLILGILMVILNLVLIFLEGSNFNRYLQVGVSLIFVIYSSYKIKNTA